MITMDNNKPNKQEAPSPFTNKDHDSSPRKPPLPSASVAGGSGGDRLKRDEWSEGAVSSLLEAYEAKWVLRNRAKLKGHDWEDVAKYVSSRANSSKSPKTQTQCKNKIESMKKRYRSESATSDVSSWPLFPRLDLLLRGSGGPPVVTSGGDPPSSSTPVANKLPLTVFEHTPPPPPPQMIQSSIPPVALPVPVPVATPVHQVIGQNSIDSNGLDRENKEDDVVDIKMSEKEINQVSEKMEIETDCSTPALYSNEKGKIQTKSQNHKNTNNRKRRRKGERESWDVAESIRWLAKVMVRSEQAKVETMRELEKMRADAEVKRGEIDLKRTEIIAHTQLEIARLFATSFGKTVDPSLRIGRS
ncbi:unnamed protein product [Lactuca saligna]|uniref:Myb/SANT-like DNA-binding domain-containing protein n=1 Tax=Lactuca saligna TaxID=75948 RepID=A0AA36EE90_LACSI|nr:unnamed protein product [Lactuca saligna]